MKKMNRTAQMSESLKSEHKNVPFLKRNVRFLDIYCNYIVQRSVNLGASLALLFYIS